MLACGQGAAVVGEAARRDGRPGSSCGWRSRQAGRTAGAAPDTPDCQGRRTPRTVKGDGHPGLPRTTDSRGLPRTTDSRDCQGRRPAGTAKDDGQLGTVSAAGSRPNSREHSLCGEGSSAKGEGSSAKIENPSGSVLYSVIILDNRVKFARSHVLPPAKHSLF